MKPSVVPTFEWDAAKARANHKKHRVHFEFAARVFLDPFRLDAEDERDNYGEERRSTVGMIDARCFVVVYTERGAAVRLISARKATSYEEASYLKQHPSKQGH